MSLIERTCVSCRQKFDKKSLTRYIKNNSDIVPDETGRMGGRGVYLCRECNIKYAQKDSKLLHRMAFQLTKKTHNGKKNNSRKTE